MFYSRLFSGRSGCPHKRTFFPEALETSADGNWGLSFGQDGEPPAANATYEILAKYNAYYAEDTKEKRIYLTFDAGFENGNTEANPGSLKNITFPPLFSSIGTYIKNNPELIRRMKEEGHTVAITLIIIRICRRSPRKNLLKKNYRMWKPNIKK